MDKIKFQTLEQDDLVVASINGQEYKFITNVSEVESFPHFTLKNITGQGDIQSVDFYIAKLATKEKQ